MSKTWIAVAGQFAVVLPLVASMAFAQTGPPGAGAPAASASSSGSGPAASSAPPADSAPLAPVAPVAEPNAEVAAPADCSACGGAVTTQDSSGATHLRYELEGIEVRGNTRTRERLVRRYAKFQPGDLIDVDDPELELIRFRLLGTGFFRSVNLSLRRGTKRGAVVLVVEVAERNTIVVNDVWMGLSADAETSGQARPLTAYGGADVAETNLAGTGITIGGAIGVAQEQLGLRARFFDPSFLGTRWMTSAVLLYNDARDFYGNRDVRYDNPSLASERVQDYAIVRYKRFGGSMGVGHDLGVPVQVWFDYRLERIDATLPLAASHRRGLDTEPIEYGLHGGLSVLSSVRATLMYDTRDSPILPTRGWNCTLSAEVSLTPLGSSYAFQKLSLSASRWWELPWGHVVRLQVFGGAVTGYSPLYERFYVGDLSDLRPDRMLDLNTDRRPAPNFLRTDIVEVRYGEYAGKVMGEYRVPIYRGHRSIFGIDLFAAAGMYGIATRRDIMDPPRGYHGLAKLPVDLTFNLGLRIDTQAGGFVFAFSNILGFIPVRGEARP